MLTRFELSDRLTGRGTVHGICPAMPYGGLGMGVGLTTLAMFIATPQLDMPDRNEGFVVPEDHLLTWVLPSPNFDMQRLLLAP